MTIREAEQHAAKLGMSTWMAEAVAVGPTSTTVTVKCVGFASIGLAMGEGETWEQAFAQATRAIFSA
jgi:hypothetical protein